MTGDGSNWTRHKTIGGIVSPRSIFVADMDGDGDRDVLGAAIRAEGLSWAENFGGQFALATSDTAPSLLEDGTSAALLSIEAVHKGRSGDTALEPVTLELMFEGSPGTPLTTGEANTLVQSLLIYRDEGNNPTISTAEDRGHDILLRLERVTNVSSSTVEFVLSPIFTDDFKSGDTSKWSRFVP